jgi:class 3 adenylate cyclase
MQNFLEYSLQRNFSRDGNGEVLILWADIVGFSALSTALADELDGRELVAQAVGELIAECLVTAQDNLATPISLGGDSWLVAWPTSEVVNYLNDAETIAQQSHMYCERISERYGFQIQLRIACAQGSAYWFRIDLNHARENLILNGSVMLKASKLISHCHPGETIFCEDLSKIERKLSESTRAANLQAVQNPLSDMQRGVCSVVFAAIQLSDFDDKSAESAVRFLARHSKQFCDQTGGRLARIRVDEKGCNILILFGFGSRSSTNDSKNAIAIARMLQRQAIENRLSLGIGICSGRVFACEVGYAAFKEFTAMGECINLASQLATQNSAGIYLDAATVEGSGSNTSIDAWINVIPKGAHATQRIAVLNNPHLLSSGKQPYKRSQHHSSLHVERQDTKKILSMLEKRSSWICLIGEPGIGKSTVLNQIVQLQKNKQTTVLTSRCTPELALGYGSAITLLLTNWMSLQICDQADSSGFIESILHLCPSELRPVCVRLISHWHGTEDITSGSSAQLFENHAEAFCQWWAPHFLNDSCLIAIEDIHWIDALSSFCLAVIRNSGTQANCICTSRQSIAKSEASLQWSEFHMTTLTTTELKRLMQNTLNVESVDNEVVAHAMKITTGNCMFAEKWSLEAVERGWYRIANSTLLLTLPTESTQLVRHDPPIILHLLLQSQIEGMSANAKELAMMMSVYGKGVAPSLLPKLFENNFDLEHALSHCIENGILTVDGFAQTYQSIRFDHALLQEACYSRLDSKLRSTMHMRVAKILSSEPDLKSNPMERAWHWMKASVDTDDALAQIFSGAMWAHKVYAIDVASEFFDYVSQQYLQKGNSHFNHYKNAYLWFVISKCQQGKTTDSALHLKSAAALLYREKPNVFLASSYLFHHLGMLFWRWSKTVSLLPVRHALIFKENPVTTSLLLLAETNYFQGKFNQYRWEAICALNSAERSGSASDLVSAYAGMAVQAAQMRVWWLSRIYAYLSMRFCRNVGESSMYVEVLFFLALRDTGCARWQRATKHIALALKRNRKFGEGRRHDELLVVQGYAMQGQENLQEANEVFNNLWRSGIRRADPQTTAWGLLGCARIAYLSGDLAAVGTSLSRLVQNDLPDVLSRLDRDALAVIRHVSNNDLLACDALLEHWSASRLREISKVTFSVGFPISCFYLATEVMNLQQAIRQPSAKINPSCCLEALKIHASTYEYSRCRYLICYSIYHHLRGNRKKSDSGFIKAKKIAHDLNQSNSLRYMQQIQQAFANPEINIIHALLKTPF